MSVAWSSVWREDGEPTRIIPSRGCLHYVGRTNEYIPPFPPRLGEFGNGRSLFRIWYEGACIQCGMTFVYIVRSDNIGHWVHYPYIIQERQSPC